MLASRVRIRVFVPLLVLIPACVRPEAAFVCAGDDECGSGGVCQAVGYCSFADQAGCASGWRYGAASGEYSTLCVGETPVENPGGSCDLNKPFGTAVRIQSITSGTEDASMRLSPDEKTAYFFSDRTMTKKLLYSGIRADLGAPFENVEPLANVNTDNQSDQYNPTITSDGLTLFFASFHPGSDNDIYQTQRSRVSDKFAPPELATNVNTAGSEVQPYVTRDGSAMYFVRFLTSKYAIYRAIGSPSAGFADPSPVAELNGVNDNADPVLSADGRTLYFASSRPGGLGDLDVWAAHRASADPGAVFTSVEHLPNVNTIAVDAPSDVSKDGCRLYLTSARDGYISVYVATRPP